MVTDTSVSLLFQATVAPLFFRFRRSPEMFTNILTKCSHYVNRTYLTFLWSLFLAFKYKNPASRYQRFFEISTWKTVVTHYVTKNVWVKLWKKSLEIGRWILSGLFIWCPCEASNSADSKSTTSYFLRQTFLGIFIVRPTMTMLVLNSKWKKQIFNITFHINMLILGKRG